MSTTAQRLDTEADEMVADMLGNLEVVGSNASAIVDYGRGVTTPDDSSSLAPTNAPVLTSVGAPVLQTVSTSDENTQSAQHPDEEEPPPSLSPKKRAVKGKPKQSPETRQQDGAEILAMLSRKTTRGASMRRLEIFGSFAVESEINQLIKDVYMATGVRVYQTRITALALEWWLEEPPADLSDIPDLSGQANLSARVPQGMRDDFLKHIYSIDMDFPYSHAALHAISNSIPRLRELLLAREGA